MTDIWTDERKRTPSGGKSVPLDSKEEQKALTDLEHDIQKVELDYEQFAEKNLDVMKDVNQQKEPIQKTNKLFCLALAGCCLTPLRKGINTKSVLRVIGLWVGCCVLSKQFRQETNDVITKAFHPLIQKKASQADPESLLAHRKMLLNESGDTLPLIPESVAVMQIAFCQQAYRKMREDGADVEAVKEKYREASEKLYEMAEKDGIRREQVDKQMRKIAGDLIDKDSSFLLIFKETAYDTVIRGKDRVHTQKYQDAGGVKTRTYSTWEGDYTNEDGSVYRGGFTPREPESVNELRRLSKVSWDRIMAKADTPEAWGKEVFNPYSMNLQQRYLYLMKTDNHLTNEQLGDLDALMDPEDDVTWLIDIDGKDPFGAGSLYDSVADVLAHGPKPDAPHMVLGGYPEFKSAFCKWLNHHPDYNPGELQRKANDAYYAYMDGGCQDENLLQTINDDMMRRMQVQQRWDEVFDGMNAELDTYRAGLAKAEKEQKLAERPLPGNFIPDAPDLSMMR